MLIGTTKNRMPFPETKAKNLKTKKNATPLQFEKNIYQPKLSDKRFFSAFIHNE